MKFTLLQLLKQLGATSIDVSFHRGEAVFELPHANVETAKQAITAAGYEPTEAEEIEATRETYDYIIIGSGAAAFASAIEARKYGAKVAMIESGTIGGTCVNIGCVPSKTLLRAGEINYLAKNHPFLGLHTSAGTVDLSALIEQKNELVQNLRQAKYIDLINEYGFTLIQGEAVFLDETTVEVNRKKLSANRFLIATGAAPAIPNIPGLADVEYVTSTTLLERKEVPKRLAVIGSGYIGIELGQLFHHLGSGVPPTKSAKHTLSKFRHE
ncbi:MAG: hypothetical protein KatS3mg080_1080 [Anoxybacillus sp.]|nr:MAG: hypothetical protein KatS3mg080_1080 [Anoxybacillus sp.]